MMALHVTCSISEETIHDEALRVDAVDQRVGCLRDKANTHIYQTYLNDTSNNNNSQPVYMLIV